MHLYLMRHGPARRDGGWADADRPLIDGSESRLCDAARGLSRLAVRPDAVCTSPLLRCRRTAEIVAVGLGLPVSRLRLCETLAGGAAAEQVLSELAAARGPGDLLVVGHEPEIVQLASNLLGGSSLALRFEPATCACFEVEDWASRPDGALLWLLTLAQLQQIGVPV